MPSKPTTLKLFPLERYKGVDAKDPIRYYYWPLVGRMYRRRVEMALGECSGGARVLEIGFGTGLVFPNLSELYQEVHGLDLTADIEAIQSVFEPLGIPLHLRNGDVRQMPYPDAHFDTVLLISILEHLQPSDLEEALREITRVLKPGGQMIYGTPVERPMMVALFRLLGHNIRNYHFSTEREIVGAARKHLAPRKILGLNGIPPILGKIYEVGHFVKAEEARA